MTIHANFSADCAFNGSVFTERFDLPALFVRSDLSDLCRLTDPSGQLLEPFSYTMPDALQFPFYFRRRLASGEGTASLGVTQCDLCVCVRRISIGGKGNALYPVLSSLSQLTSQR